MEPNGLSFPVGKQEHEQLAFFGGSFKGSQLNWSTFEQEAFAIFQTTEKVDYLLMEVQQVHILTDHRSLFSLFAPYSFEFALGLQVVSKV